MQRRTFGWTGVQVPVIGQGTWKMEGDSPAEALAALQAGLDAGMTHVDTAELYGGGRVEALVARAIAGRRDEVFLVSKVMPDHASRSGTVQACEASLRRLGTDHLDCYLLHWPGQHPLEDTIAAFEQLVRDGKIRTLGPEQLRRGRSRGGAGHRRAGPHRLQPGPVPPGGAGHRARA